MAERLVDAGVEDVDGFALNVSNFQFTQNSNQFGSWISKCIEYATHVDPGNFDACPDQYGSFGGVALSSYGRWSDKANSSALNTRAENRRYRDAAGRCDSHNPLRRGHEPECQWAVERAPTRIRPRSRTPKRGVTRPLSRNGDDGQPPTPTSRSLTPGSLDQDPGWVAAWPSDSPGVLIHR